VPGCQPSFHASPCQALLAMDFAAEPRAHTAEGGHQFKAVYSSIPKPTSAKVSASASANASIFGAF
jgi:hypothetical protein